MLRLALSPGCAVRSADSTASSAPRRGFPLRNHLHRPGIGTSGPGDPPLAAHRAAWHGCGIRRRPQGGNHGPELSGAGESPSRRAVEPLAVAGQVAAGDPALHRAVLLVDRVRRRHRHSVLRDLVHRALPPPAVQLQSGGAALVVAGRLLHLRALGTDRYPPSSLDQKPDYPATLDVAYPRGFPAVWSWSNFRCWRSRSTPS